MKIRAGLPAGVNALLFEAARRRRRLEGLLCGRLEEDGFSEVLLPILDYFDPYQSLLSETSRERLYRFVDRDGQLLALRGDFTPMLARLIAPRLQALELPQRLFYRGDVVRYQEVRPGRMREYSELGVELLDERTMDNDQTVLALFADLLLIARGGLTEAEDSAQTATDDLRIVVGRAGALDNLVQEVGGDITTLADVARRDRGAARRKSAALAEIVESGTPAELSVLGDEAARQVESLKARCTRLEARFAGTGVHVAVDLAEFATSTLSPRLGPEHSPDQISEADASLADRGYYDGIVFKAYLAGSSQPVGRGGRYDRLFAALGAEVGATGFSLAIDRLLPSDRSKARADLLRQAESKAGGTAS